MANQFAGRFKLTMGSMSSREAGHCMLVYVLVYSVTLCHLYRLRNVEEEECCTEYGRKWLWPVLTYCPS
jgi:hypothetical protein